MDQNTDRAPRFRRSRQIPRGCRRRRILRTLNRQGLIPLHHVQRGTTVWLSSPVLGTGRLPHAGPA